MKKRVLAILLASCLTLSLAGCGKDEIKKEVGNNTKVEEIKVWAIWGGGDSMAEPFAKAVEATQKEIPEAKIIVDITSNESYKTKIKSAVAADEAPDIYFTYGAGFNKPFVDAGKNLEITNLVSEQTKKSMLPGVLVNYTFDGKLYGLPTSQQVSRLFVNTEILKANGIETPKTYKELLEAVKILNKKGVTPISLGAKDVWAVGKLFDIIGLRSLGTANTAKLLKGEIPFTDNGLINAAKKFDELIKAGAFTKNPVAITNDEALADFTKGKSAMFYNGSWSCGTINGSSSSVAGKVIAVPFPVFEDGAGLNTEFVGGAGDGFVINSKVKNPELAIKVLEKLAYNCSKYGYQAGSTIPVYNVEVDESKIDTLFKSIKKQTETATGYTLWWDSTLEGSVAQDYLSSLIELLVQNTTPEKFAKTVQESMK